MSLIPITVVCSECERYLPLSIDECVDQAGHVITFALAGLIWTNIRQQLHCPTCTAKRMANSTKHDAVLIANAVREMQQHQLIQVQS